MENEHKEKIKDESTTDQKKYKKKKSVNWESKKLDENKVPDESLKNKENDKDLLEIEVINKDGSTKKEHVKYESKESKEFVKKREERAHDEYTKAKEFLESHKNEGE